MGVRVEGQLRITAEREYARYVVKCSTGETIPLDEDGLTRTGVTLSSYKTGTEGVTALYAGFMEVAMLGDTGNTVWQGESQAAECDITDALEDNAGRVTVVSVALKDSEGGSTLAVQSFSTVRDGASGEDASAARLALETGTTVPCTAFGVLKTGGTLEVEYSVNGVAPGRATLAAVFKDERGGTIRTAQASTALLKNNPWDMAREFAGCISAQRKAPYTLEVTASGVDGSGSVTAAYSIVYDTPPYTVRPETEWNGALTFRNGDILALEGEDGDGNATLDVYMWSYPVGGNSLLAPQQDIEQNPDTTHWAAFSSFGMLATRLFFAQYALVKNLGVETVEVNGDNGRITMRNASGSVLFEVKGGNVTCKTGTFENVTVTGTVNALAGTIGGFRIGSNTLGASDNAADTTLHAGNAAKGMYASIGANATPAGGAMAIGRFTNEQDWGAGWYLQPPNIGASVRSSGTKDSIALDMDGGCVRGLAIKNRVVTADVTLTRQDTYIVCGNTDAITVTLPSMQLDDDGHVIIIKRANSGGVNVKCQPCQTIGDSGASYGSAPRTAMPTILYSGSSTVPSGGTAGLSSRGDAWMLVWVRDYNARLGTYGTWVQTHMGYQ